MEDSFKGMWVTITIIAIFIMCIVNFIVLFPGEQGFTLSHKDNQSQYVIENINQGYVQERIDTAEAASKAGYDAWNIEVGFMGSNTQKSSRGNIFSYIGDIFTNLKTMAYELFGIDGGFTEHPIVIVFGILIGLVGLYITYLTIKFIRTGN
jgi:hypothetical protein